MSVIHYFMIYLILIFIFLPTSHLYLFIINLINDLKHHDLIYVKRRDLIHDAKRLDLIYFKYHDLIYFKYRDLIHDVKCHDLIHHVDSHLLIFINDFLKIIIINLN